MMASKLADKARTEKYRKNLERMTVQSLHVDLSPNSINNVAIIHLLKLYVVTKCSSILGIKILCAQNNMIVLVEDRTWL